MSQQILHRRGTAAAWTSANPVLAQGEWGFETDTKKFKIGDGSAAWSSLAYTATAGDTGARGAPGVDGEDGADGMPGTPGLTGATGSQGVTGDTGATGPAVFMAADPGEDGDPGVPGKDGIDGAAGAPGNTGAQGPSGPAVFMEAEAGDDGAPGPAGANGTAGANGSTGAQGPAGPPIYLQADEGEEGARGPPGTTGPAGANGTGVTVKNLGTDLTSSSTTMVKATNIDQVVGIGTWSFEYRCVWQTTATGTAVKFGINHSGTVTRLAVECTGFEATTAASTGVMSAVGAAFGLRSGGQNNVISTTTSIFGPTGVTTANVDHMAIIRGIIVVSASGNLELYFGSEATGSTQTLGLPTSLILIKIS